MRLIVGIAGASGVVMGYKLLKALKLIPECETHLILTEAAIRNFELETDIPIKDIKSLADVCHDNQNIAATVASGSFKTNGMIIAPCSMKTLAGISSGYASNLLLRAADVCLKENRKVVLVPREMPLGKIHIHNLMKAADFNCTIIPPMLTFYNNPQSLDDQIEHIIGKILMQFDIDYRKFKAWEGA